jgi:hypothetical protein
LCLALQHAAFSLTTLSNTISTFRSGANFTALIKLFSPPNSVPFSNFSWL